MHTSWLMPKVMLILMYVYVLYAWTLCKLFQYYYYAPARFVFRVNCLFIGDVEDHRYVVRISRAGPVASGIQPSGSVLECTSTYSLAVEIELNLRFHWRRADRHAGTRGLTRTGLCNITFDITLSLRHPPRNRQHNNSRLSSQFSHPLAVRRFRPNLERQSQ